MARLLNDGSPVDGFSNDRAQALSLADTSGNPTFEEQLGGSRGIRGTRSGGGGGIFGIPRPSTRPSITPSTVAATTAPVTIAPAPVAITPAPVAITPAPVVIAPPAPVAATTVTPTMQVESPIRGGATATGVLPNAQPVAISRDQIQAEIQSQAQTLANELIRVRDLETIKVQASGRVFTLFDFGADVIENQKTFVTTGLFSNNAATMSAFYTSSAQTNTSKNYYYEVWNGTAVNSEAQFSVAYGHRKGSGSSAQGTLNDSPSRAVYSQYKLLLLNPGDTSFTFADGRSSDSIYAINFNRARLKDKLDPGNWQINLAQLSGSQYANNVHTGSNVQVVAVDPVIISLIDDSGDTQEALTTTGRIYNVVSGSITSGIHNAAAPHYYGLSYPEMGVIILNGAALNASASFNTVSGSNIAGDNAWKLYTSISGAAAANVLSYPVQARNEETVTSTHYFVRVKNGEYNFSNNPTFTTGSVGEFSQPTFIGDPKVYITTVGMYNNRQELLAVAKLSQPIQKSFSNEALIKVKLDF